VSRLEKLIQTHCPDGVEFRKIKDTYKRLNGTPITAGKMREIEKPDGDVRIFAGGKTVINAFEEDVPNANIINIPAVLVQSRGVIDAVFYDKPFTFKNEMWAYTAENRISVKYLYYVLKNNIEQFRDAASGMGSMPQISLKVTEDYKIPFPPLPVQEEIVRILDTFTELEAELEKELEARTKQYEYYRDDLLSFESKSRIIEKLLANIWPEEIEFLRLGGKEGICKVVPSGVDKVINKNEQTVKLCNFMDVYDNRYITDDVVDQLMDGSVNNNEYERFVLREGQVLLTKDSETKEDIAQSAYVCKDFDNVVCGYHLAVLTPVIKINGKYLNYVLQSNNLRNYFSKLANGVSRYGLKLKSIEDALIPAPPLEVQEQIVSILDRFDTLVNDLKSGLPAEIALRRKQCEYYRDKLLTFKQNPTP
jgi:type I restriction enzyme S subunit